MYLRITRGCALEKKAGIIYGCSSMHGYGMHAGTHTHTCTHTHTHTHSLSFCFCSWSSPQYLPLTNLSLLTGVPFLLALDHWMLSANLWRLCLVWPSTQSTSATPSLWWPPSPLSCTSTFSARTPSFAPLPTTPPSARGPVSADCLPRSCVGESPAGPGVKPAGTSSCAPSCV